MRILLFVAAFALSALTASADGLREGFVRPPAIEAPRIESGFRTPDLASKTLAIRYDSYPRENPPVTDDQIVPEDNVKVLARGRCRTGIFRRRWRDGVLISSPIGRTRGGSTGACETGARSISPRSATQTQLR